MAATRKGTAKLSEIRNIEKEMQEKWAKEKVFELDAPDDKWVPTDRQIFHEKYTIWLHVSIFSLEPLDLGLIVGPKCSVGQSAK